MSAFRFHGNNGHLGFYSTRQRTVYNFRTASSNAVKSCPHIDDEMYVSVFGFVELHIFSVINTKFDNSSDFLRTHSILTMQASDKIRVLCV